MVRFAHISDVHLGGWKQEPLRNLNFQSFQKAVSKCIDSKLDFVIIVGDLFDSAYPPIEILKETFAEFRRLKDAKIPCFIIAGSHDYSVSGKTFLDVLEKAGFCKNVTDFEVDEEKKIIYLNPVVHQGVAMYGYPGKKSGLEIEDLRRIKLQDSPGMFKIFMLHTTIDKAKGTLPIDAIETEKLPQADYYALGHLHIDFQYENFVYPGPVFPNNFQELEDLQEGGFYIVDTESGSGEKLQKVTLKTNPIESVEIEITNALTATEKILSELNKRQVKDKIILLRVRGDLEKGKHSDIKFRKIQEYLEGKGAYFMLKNTHDLNVKELEMEMEISDSENIEEETIEKFSDKNPSDFNSLIPQLMECLSLEKQEDEKKSIFTSRLLEGAKKVLKF